VGAHVRRGARGLKKLDGPVIVVHSLDHALAALTAATAAGRPIVVLSASDSGIYAGPGWFKALVDAAREAAPAANAVFILDCGDDAGAAQGAIRAGIEALIFSGRTDVAERLAEVATARGLRLLTKRPIALLDLGDLFFADDETLRRHCADRLASCSAIC
jgi:hypothetical protein